jgi:hypothetical protein
LNHPTPCRSFAERRGVLFRQAAVALALLPLAGCNLWPDTPPATQITAKPVPTPKSGKKPGGKPQITAEVLREWVNRWTKPLKRTAVTSQPALIYIDPVILEHRHPAWELANALEAGAAPAPARIVPVSVPQKVVPPPEVAPPSAAETRTELPPITMAIRGSEQAQRRLQNASTERFLADTSRRDAAMLRDVQRWARQFLEDEVANARRQALSELDPSLLPSDVQLELTNLRLQQALDALPASPRTPAEKAATTARIHEIELQWQEVLRAQEAEQVRKFNVAMNDVPEKVRKQGQERIQQLVARIRTDRSTSREAVREEQAALLANDFAPGSLDLSLRLPAANSVRLPEGGRTYQSVRQFSKTSSAGLPSVGQFEENGALTVSRSNATQAQIRRLRSLAQSDARDWARLAALSLGGRWSDSPRYPNRTHQALDLLVGTRSKPASG